MTFRALSWKRRGGKVGEFCNPRGRALQGGGVRLWFACGHPKPAIPPLAPTAQREVANLAYFAAAPPAFDSDFRDTC